MNEIVHVGKHNVTFNVSRHMHNTWELICYTSGEGKMIFDDCTIPYRENDVIVIPPYMPHTNLSDNGFTNIFINIADSNLNFHTPVKIHDDATRHIRGAFEAVHFHYNEEKNQDNLLVAFGHLLVAYVRAYQQTPARSEIVEEIRANIAQNFSDCDYELDTFLRSLPFSYDYLRKLFKKEMGITPHQYLCDKRLNTAAEWLSSAYNDTGNIAEVGRLCGFNEPLYFSRMFKKKFGISPSFYRSERLQNVKRLDPDKVKITSEDA